MKNKRKEERIDIELPDFISAEFVVEKGPEKGKMLNLKVINYSKHGLGLLVTEDDFETLKFVEPGDKMKDLILYASRVLIKTDVEIIHLTKINRGPYKGFGILGVRSDDIFNICTKEKVNTDY